MQSIMFFHCIFNTFCNVFSLQVFYIIYSDFSFYDRCKLQRYRDKSTNIIFRYAQNIFVLWYRPGATQDAPRTALPRSCRFQKIALYREITLTPGRGEICTLKEKSVNLHFICKSTELTLYFIMIFSYTLFDTFKNGA